MYYVFRSKPEIKFENALAEAQDFQVRIWFMSFLYQKGPENVFLSSSRLRIMSYNLQS